MNKLILSSFLLLTMSVLGVKKPAPKTINNENEARRICPTICGKDNWQVGKYTPDACECTK